MINARTRLIALFGFPIETVKAPMIYNPWFQRQGINAVVMPIGVRPEDYAVTVGAMRRQTNFHGALVTMPHKVATLSLVDEVTPTAQIAGASNAILKRADGSLVADQFDGVGFVRGVHRKGLVLAGARALVSGSGGVGCAIAASLAAAGVAELALYDQNASSCDGLAARLREHYPLRVSTGSNDPAGFDLVVNATPLGVHESDPLPFDVSRIAPSTFVGEVVMKHEFTPLLQAAKARGCTVQVGADMLFEMIPAYLEFFGYGTATPEELRASSDSIY